MARTMHSTNTVQRRSAALAAVVLALTALMGCATETAPAASREDVRGVRDRETPLHPPESAANPFTLLAAGATVDEINTRGMSIYLVRVDAGSRNAPRWHRDIRTREDALRFCVVRRVLGRNVATREPDVRFLSAGGRPSSPVVALMESWSRDRRLRDAFQVLGTDQHDLLERYASCTVDTSGPERVFVVRYPAVVFPDPPDERPTRLDIILLEERIHADGAVAVAVVDVLRRVRLDQYDAAVR